MLWNKWIAAIRRENWLPTDHTRICSKHFIKGCPSRGQETQTLCQQYSATPLLAERTAMYFRPKSSGISVWLKGSIQKRKQLQLKLCRVGIHLKRTMCLVHQHRQTDVCVILQHRQTEVCVILQHRQKYV